VARGVLLGELAELPLSNRRELFPGETNIADRAVLLKNLSGKGLTKIYGAAYDGYFLY